MLTPDQLEHWHQQGYLALPGFKSASDVETAVERAHALVQAFDPGTGASRFSTRDRGLVADAALLASAHAVHCFFEEEALHEDGSLRVPKSQSINKIGHALHALDPVFKAFSHGPALAGLVAALGIQQPLLWQSQLIFKQPHIGGEVGWHQDASFFFTTPQSVTTLWFALEDATLDNGCLWLVPAGQRGAQGVLREQYVCNQGRLQMHALDDTPWPAMDEALPLPVAAGTLLVFNGLMPHCSQANRSGRSRLAYTLHITDGDAVYSPLNWLQQGPDLPPRGLA